MKRIKITYLDNGIVKSVIDYYNGLYDIQNVCLKHNVYDWNLISIEVVMTADENNTIDYTKQ